MGLRVFTHLLHVQCLNSVGLSIYHPNIITAANIIHRFQNWIRIVRPNRQTPVLIDTSRSWNWIRIVNCKSQTADSFFPYRDDGRRYTL